MTDGEFVFPEVIVGITDASATRRERMPLTRRRSSRTAPDIRFRPHLDRSHRMENRCGDILGGAQQFLIAL